MKRPSVIGILVLLIGVLFLLSELHVIAFSGRIFTAPVVWSLILALVGLFGLFGNRHKISLFSLFLLVLGLVLAARNASLVTLLNRTSGWNLFWGLLIVFIGLELLLPRRWRRIHVSREKWADHVHISSGEKRTSIRHGWKKSHWKDTHDYRKTETRKWLGDLSLGQSPWVLRDMNLWNGIGDIRINLATAHMEAGTYHIALGGWIGDVRLLIPDGVGVEVSGSVHLGDVSVFGKQESGVNPLMEYTDENFQEANVKLYLDIDLKIGDVQILRV